MVLYPWDAVKWVLEEENWDQFEALSPEQQRNLILAYFQNGLPVDVPSVLGKWFEI